MATPLYDPTEGVTTKTTKDDMLDRLRKAKRVINGLDRQNKVRLQEIEDRIRAKGVPNEADLRQVIVSATEQDWKDSIEFLEEFEDLLPVSLQRLVIGGRTLLQQIDAAG